MSRQLRIDLPEIAPDFSFEDRVDGRVCGVDEAGRGPLAGPVVAAAVVLDRSRIPGAVLEQINDSKQLPGRVREYLYHKLHDYAEIAIAECTVAEIDRMNILQASMRAMEKAVAGLEAGLNAALVDGNRLPANLPCPGQALVRGDGRSYSIAAASIIAKHHRDLLMRKYAEKHPHYGWERNAGYGTALHLAAIDSHGVTRLHRKSFAPVAEYLRKKKAG